jgi:hypothetical protein
MSRRCPKVARLALALALTLGPACQRPRDVTQEVYRVEGTALTLPRLGDWIPDPSVSPGNSAQGGLMMRLVQKNSVPGSPRIEVRLEPPTAVPTVLDAYLTRNLRDMGALETAGEIRILHVDQQHTTVGHVPAWRVHHDFTTGTGASQVSLYQVSTFLVFEGRGITLSAAGRTELFHPLAASIAQVLDGASLDATRIKSRKDSSSTTIDLGTVGGPRT